jgi:hypothetical protein
MRLNYTDQSRPVQSGFVRVAGRFDLAQYDDEAFLEFTKDDPAWEIMLEASIDTRATTSEARLYREGVFNTHHFDNQLMAERWNDFIAKRRLLAECKRFLALLDGTADTRHPSEITQTQEGVERLRASIAYVEGTPLADEVIHEASGMVNDMDDAVRHIQEFLGVTDGGFASIHFDGQAIPSTPAGTVYDDLSEAWPFLASRDRLRLLKAYSDAEIAFGSGKAP